ncbi:hypothetical protein Glove_61g9 [Diversispora epigaea]|uniref:BTB domain-containing protein n=1 Tax=Diversispora epigaea TaxID=1348612 RepID=A0A397JMK7_9GLOM|nr:hypothetical protein Glove_61g9 [Diversispora epigaea]
MTIQFHDRLANDLTQPLEIGEEISLPNIYKVHSIVLQSCSHYFKKKFEEITFNENLVKVLKNYNELEYKKRCPDIENNLYEFKLLVEMDLMLKLFTILVIKCLKHLQF